MKVNLTLEETAMLESFNFLPMALNVTKDECMPYSKVSEKIIDQVNKIILTGLNLLSSQISKNTKTGKRYSKDELIMFNNIKRKFQEEVYNLNK